MKKHLLLLFAFALSVMQGFSQVCTADYTLTQSGATVSFTNASSGSYSWLYYDFGDGNTSSNPNPTHTYAPGLYLACLYIGDSMQNCYDYRCDSIWVNGGGGCQASFQFYPDSMPGSFWFVGSSTGSAPFTYFWDFGDGNTSTQQSPNHVYAQAGTYTACLTTTDATGCSSTTCQTITFTGGGGGGCTASFWSYPDSTQSGLYIFDANATGTAPFTYVWDFGDGTTGTGDPVTHQYNAPGTYQVCLTMTDASGCTSTYCDFVTYNFGGGCQAMFTYTNSGNTFDFTNLSTGNYDYVYWTFGDGNTSSSFNPTHTYSAAGWYGVCLTISDSAQTCSSTTCDSIYISGGGGGGGCGVSFVAVPDSAGGYHLVTTVTGSGPYAYFWDFGDGNTSTQQNPSHTYQQTGAYTICVTITDNNQCTATYCDSLWFLGGGTMSSSIIIGTDEIEMLTQTSNIYPNPNNGTAWIDITAAEQTQSTIQIYNTSGQLISSNSQSLMSGQNRIKIETHGLAEGLYLLRIEAGNASVTESFIKR